MTYQEIINKIKPEMDKTISFLEREMTKVHTGRPSIALIEDIKVDCFGQSFLLKELGAISLAGPREIIVQPWDKSYLEPIEKAISRSGQGMNVTVDREVIRLSFPAPSQEYRKELLRVISEKQEAARKTLRHWRDKAWRELQERERTGQLREDDKFRGKDALQELIDEYNEKIKNLVQRKHKEIME